MRTDPAARRWAPFAAAIAIVIAFSVIGYLPSFQVPFVFDDIVNIVLNPRVQPSSIMELDDALDARGLLDRPVAMVTFALNYLYGRLDVSSYHAVNLAIHVAGSLVLFFLLHQLAQSPRSPAVLAERRLSFAFAGALVWAVHPVNTQAVTYIVQRMASLAALFYLLALLCFVLWRLGRLRGRWAAPLIVLSGALAFGSKENAATLPAAIILVDIVFFTGMTRRHYIAMAGAVALGAILAITFASDAFHHVVEVSPDRGFSGIQRLMTQGRVIWHYLSLLLWPDAARLHLDYDIAVSTSLLDPPSTALAWLALLVITGTAIAGARRWPWPAAGWLFFLLALSVESGIFLLEMVFEHRVYLPGTLLIAGLIAPIVTAVPGRAGMRSFRLATFVIAALLTLQTIERNSQWANATTFWQTDLSRGASSDRASLNAAVDKLRTGHPEEALRLLEPELAGSADIATRAKILQVHGEASLLLGNPERALERFRQVLELRPFWNRSAYYAGEAFLLLGHVEHARRMLEQIEEFRPDSVYHAALAASIARHERQLALAGQHLKDFIVDGRSPRAADETFARMHLASVLQAMDQPARAMEQYREVVRQNPHNWTAWSRMYWMLVAGGDPEQAGRIKRFLDQHGVNPEAWR